VHHLSQFSSRPRSGLITCGRSTNRQHETPERSDASPVGQTGQVEYVTGDEAGFRRRRRGKGFCYRLESGLILTDPASIQRIKALAIPPAWSDVWICANPRGHIQAIGRDAKGRKQYRYHPDFRAGREQAKFEHMVTFAQALGSVRERIDSDLRRPGLPREKVLAGLVRLLEISLIRVGNTAYARANASYGLTTLLNEHVDVVGGELKFHFKGKSGKFWRLSLRDRRIAKVIKACQDLPGQSLFQYLDSAGAPQQISSTDVNDYLRSISGADITAKDFRTWAATVMAATTLSEQAACDLGGSAAKRALNQAMKRVAQRLGNTPTVCRQHYVHPAVIAAHMDQGVSLPDPPDEAAAGLDRQEAAVLLWLIERSQAPPPTSRTTAAPPKPSLDPRQQSTRRRAASENEKGRARQGADQEI